MIKKFLEILAPNQSPVLTLLLFFLKESTEFVLRFNRCVFFQNNQNLQELYIGNNQLTNIREIFNLKVKHIYLNLCLAGFLKKLPPDRSLPSNSSFFFSAKVAIIKNKSATIAFFSSPPFFFLTFSFSPFFSFAASILELIGRQNPAFWPFSLK